ncbi:filamentous haemagglutinin family protein [Candidatus Methylocalor cossyra]|uniref:Hemagglutinin-related protein n=1 Tax=Candidatus Methylocalor cossyra TaxID=3108543 RepID=A0ABM9NKE3_9GAMM
MRIDRFPAPRGSRIPCRLTPLAASIRAILASVMLASGAEALELPVPKAEFATLGQAEAAVAGNQLTVRQATDRAVLNWQSFNVSQDGAVEFKQPSASAIALNRIFQNDPSRIFGRIAANGQIYLLNQNGFVFGKGATVDVNTLVASTLDISDDTFQRGITKVLGQDGRPALVGNGQVFRRDADGNFVLDAQGKREKIKIQFEPGASVKVANAGRIIVAAPAIENRGELSAPDGQILLVAASDKVYLQEASPDSQLRGLLVEVGQGGEVNNLGKLLAERGNVTLMGFAVNQQGRVSATTSVRTNGSVRLLAREGGSVRREADVWLLQPGTTKRNADQGDGLGTRAKVVLGKGSLTEATPDLKDKAKAVDGQPQDPSWIEIMGQQVRVERGATLRSLSGKVTVTATENPANPGLDNIKNDSRVYIDRGAVIDVSGVKGVSLPMERNVVELELRSNELRDSPLQRNGVLYAKKVRVDIRKGTPIADITGALERIARTVAERSTKGGSLTLVSEGDAVVRAGSRLNFSGGSVLYRPGYIDTTQLVTDDGRIVDIGVADPNQHYAGILGQITRRIPAWHIVQRWDMHGPQNRGRFEPGYREGKPAGSLTIKAAALALDGEMEGGAVNGIRQRDPALQVPGGHLTIDLARTPDSTQPIVFQSKAAPLAIGPDDPFPRDPKDGNQPAPLVLAGHRLVRSGIYSAELATAGTVHIGAGERVSVPDGGSLSLRGGEIHVDGAIVAHSGTVDLTTQLTGATLGRLSGIVELGPRAKIDARGGWVNDRPAQSTGDNRLDPAPIRTGGGQVKVSAQGDVHLAAGSLVDVSGGARRRADGKIEPGDAGSIQLEAAAINGSNLSVEGRLRGYALSGGKGGALSLISDAVQIGGTAPEPAAGAPRPLILGPDFFTRGGFARYAVGSNKSGITVAAGADVKVSVANRVLDGDYASRPSGSNLEHFSHIAQLPVTTRPAGQLTLTLGQKVGQGGPNAAVTIGPGARLRTDAGGQLAVASDASIFVNGTLEAPAGKLSLTVTPPLGTDPGFLPGQGIWLGPGAELRAPGQALLYRDGLGRSRGEVLPGGSIQLHADRGFIVAAPGSRIDVSGTAAPLDLAVPGPNGGIASERQSVPSAGGQIELRAAEGIQLHGELSGRADAARGAAGGSLSLELNPRTRNEPDQIVPGQLPFPRVPSIIRVDQGGGTDTPQPGKPVPSDQFGLAVLNPGQVDGGGFGSLTLRAPDRIELVGGGELKTERSIALDAPALAFQSGTQGTSDTVAVRSAYVALGSTQTRPGAVTPSAGPGKLEVNAGTLDLVGTAALQGFGAAALTSGGDLRAIGVRTTQQQRDFLGEFLVAGDLSLKATQVYPTTLSDFRIAVQGKSDGLLQILPGAPGGTPPPVLSAGGRLSLEAPRILQAGTVKAPQGQLALTAQDSLELAAGSVTSNSGRGNVVPFGRTQGGLDWIYPLGEQNLVFAAPPVKQLALKGKTVDLAAGAQIDTQGGGDLFAFEFVPGPGGSADLLDPADPNYRPSYAVLPALGNGVAPYDPLEFPASGLKVGDSIYLSGGGGLKAGQYTLLPAHYALLPGAFLVTPEPGTTDLIPGQRLLRGDGAPIVAGYRTVAGTAIRDPRWSGFAVEPGSRARLRAEYAGNFANKFFADRAAREEQPTPFLPQDAGQMLMAAQTSLNLDGRVAAAPAAGGRGGRLDIDAQNIAVVAGAGGQPVEGAVNLSASKLTGLGVSSILLGGVREASDGSVTIKADASTIRLEPGAALSGPELILAAKDRITLAEGASVAARGTAEGEGQYAPERKTFHLDGDAALLRVATSGQADLQRSGVQGQTGSIAVGAGATVAASGSMILDATADAQLQGKLETSGGSVALGAHRIDLGDTAGAAGSLVLSNALLGSLKANELLLRSGTDIGLFGAVDLTAQQLTLSTGGLLGFANAGQTARLQADQVRIGNPLGAVAERQGDGTGTLTIGAKAVELDGGDYRWQGFAASRVEASGAITGLGTGSLTVAGDLTLKAASIGGGRGADTVIEATGHRVDIESAGAAPSQPAEPALGARLAVNADDIRVGGAIALPSGVVKLNALKGDVRLTQGSSIDVSGRELALGGAAIQSDGGRIELGAASGNVVLDAGATLQLGGQRGGSLSVSAPKGTFLFGGTADAHGTAAGGSFTLDVGALGNGGALTGLGTTLAGAGFSDALQVRARTGDLVLPAGNDLVARAIQLSADQGALRIAGGLTAQGPDASLGLRAGRGLELAGTAKLEAHGSPGHGGRVQLESVGDDGTGAIRVDPGAQIDLAATDGTANGVLNLRAPRRDSEVAISGDVRAAVKGAQEATVEAVRIYDRSGQISASDIKTWMDDTQSFMGNAAAIEQRLGLPGGLRPGVEIHSSGDLTLGADGWDLLGWRYDGRPGVLTLSAAGNLTIAGRLSDGFKNDRLDLSGLLGPGAVTPVTDMLQPGLSWSYRLRAGGDVTLGPGATVRTGTGDIEVSAGHDLVLGDGNAALYTAGRPTDTQRYGSFKNSFVAYRFYGEYPVDGGNITVNAGNDVRGAPTGQFFDGWLVRTGDWSRNADHSGETPTAWAVAVGTAASNPTLGAAFHQNIGALGGGNVEINAGRDVVDLSVMIPTTGKQVGQPSQPDNPADTGFSSNQVAVLGGGDLTVRAGGDVLGGVFYTGRGSGTIDAAGSIGGSGLGPVLALGDTRFSLTAGRDIQLGAALNPTVVNNSRSRDFFFTYSPDSAIALTALSGNITLQNDIGGVIDAVNQHRPAREVLGFPGSSLSALSVYPATLNASALQGDIRVERSFVTYPAATAGFNLFAGGDITTGTVGENVNITQSDADPSLLPSVAFPATSWEDAVQRLQPFGDPNLIDAQVPVHRGDPDPARLYAKGSIIAADPLLLAIPKPVDVRAGKDLRDVSFKVQHPDYALSSFQAGRDLRFTSPRNAQGNLINLTRDIEVGGPGQVWVSAGRNIDLGASEGIFTLGNTFNRALAEAGASISVLAGLGQAPQFEAFAKRYDPFSSKYAAALTAYMRARNGIPLDAQGAAAAYRALPEEQRREFLLRIFFGELRAAAAKAARTGRKADYQPGFEAIETLFPGSGSKASKYRGDLSLFFSKIHTVSGGDINLLVPGGKVNAGLAVAFAGAKPASDLGIVAEREGAVNAFVDGDFLVNQSRVFAMNGGDITIWSSNGNIDAGRGAKSAIAVPPPLVTFDERGNLKVVFPPVVSGSGIRTAASTAPRPGDVFLAAPRGVVNAGEAGIGGTNITIAATAVIGASNIDVGGTATGVPATNVAPPITPAGATNAATSVAKTAQQTVGAQGEAQQAVKRKELAEAARLTPLVVEVLGFGECSTADVRKGLPGCGGGPSVQ